MQRDQISDYSYQDDDRISRKSQGSNLKEFSKSITSSIGSIFKKQNMIKIAPSSAVHPVGLPEQSEEMPLKKEEPVDDAKSESSKLRLKIKK